MRRVSAFYVWLFLQVVKCQARSSSAFCCSLSALYLQLLCKEAVALIMNGLISGLSTAIHPLRSTERIPRQRLPSISSMILISRGCVRTLTKFSPFSLRQIACRGTNELPLSINHIGGEFHYASGTNIHDAAIAIAAQCCMHTQLPDRHATFHEQALAPLISCSFHGLSRTYSYFDTP
jgi:hypothetical protein